MTVIALGVSEYLIAYYVITREFGASLSLLLPLRDMLDIVLTVLQGDPLTLAFWAFAVVAAAYIPLKAIKPAETRLAPQG